MMSRWFKFPTEVLMDNDLGDKEKNLLMYMYMIRNTKTNEALLDKEELREMLGLKSKQALTPYINKAKKYITDEKVIYKGQSKRKFLVLKYPEKWLPIIEEHYMLNRTNSIAIVNYYKLINVTKMLNISTEIEDTMYMKILGITRTELAKINDELVKAGLIENIKMKINLKWQDEYRFKEFSEEVEQSVAVEPIVQVKQTVQLNNVGQCDKAVQPKKAVEKLVQPKKKNDVQVLLVPYANYLKEQNIIVDNAWWGKGTKIVNSLLETTDKETLELIIQDAIKYGIKEITYIKNHAQVFIRFKALKEENAFSTEGTVAYLVRKFYKDTNAPTPTKDTILKNIDKLEGMLNEYTYKQLRQALDYMASKNIKFDFIKNEITNALVKQVTSIESNPCFRDRDEYEIVLNEVLAGRMRRTDVSEIYFKRLKEDERFLSFMANLKSNKKK